MVQLRPLVLLPLGTVRGAWCCTIEIEILFRYEHGGGVSYLHYLEFKLLAAAHLLRVAAVDKHHLY